MAVHQRLALLLVLFGAIVGWWLWTSLDPADEPRAHGPVAEEGERAAEREPEVLQATDGGSERLAVGESDGAAVESDAGAVPSPTARARGVQRSLLVRVVDANHHPLEGVPVVLSRGTDLFPRFESEGVSAADGLVKLEFTERADSSMLRVAPAGPGWRERAVRVSPSRLGDDPVLLVLGPVAGLDVHVVDEAGATTDGSTVRLITPADFDAASGDLAAIDTTRMTHGRVQGGVCAFDWLTADTDVLVLIEGVSPLGSTTLRARTPGAGQRSRVEARFSGEDVVLLGELRGDITDAHWSWSIFDPRTAEVVSANNPQVLSVAEDGQFTVRLPPALWRNLGPAPCLVVRRDSKLLEVIELPSVVAPGTVRLAPIDATLQLLCGGHVHLEFEGEAPPVLLVAMGTRRPGDQGQFFAGLAMPDAEGSFSMNGRVPVGWSWRFESATLDWQVVPPAELHPGRTDFRVALVRPQENFSARLVPGSALAAVHDWTDHMLVQVNLHDGSHLGFQLVDSNGRFDTAAPLEEIASITVRARWHDRPIHEWKVGPGDALNVVLPAGLRIVRLDVRGPDEMPRKAKACEPATDGASRYRRGAQSPLFLLFDQPAHDVLVQADGFRDTLVSAVSGDLRVDLEEGGVPLLLRAHEVPELPTDVRLRALLSRGPLGTADFDTTAFFNSRGEATLLAGGVGDYFVHVQVERVGQGRQTLRVIDGAQSPRIQVSEVATGSDPQVFTLTLDLERILEVIESMR